MDYEGRGQSQRGVEQGGIGVNFTIIKKKIEIFCTLCPTT